MNKTEKKTASASILPIFDTAENLTFEAAFPAYLKGYGKYKKDYFGAHSFLYAYKDNAATFNAYRREVERLLHWSWQVAEKSILKLQRIDIEAYIKFCQNPPKRWIGISKPPRFIEKNGLREPNAEWRPFVATATKVNTKEGKSPNRNEYALSEKAVKEIFTVLSSFYNYLIQESYAVINPILQIRQKSKFIRRQQGQRPVRRLTALQWSIVIETAEKMAKENKEHERTLFIMTILYAMYLRISELAVSKRWSPKMSDFKQDHEGNWWFTTVGKGNKERQIAVSRAMLTALKRWRQHLQLPLLPGHDDQSPLIPKLRGQGGVISTNQIRAIVQACFDQAIEVMEQEGLHEEVESLRSATVHWLRHTGISEDVKIRPREHVRDDAGHSSSQTTDRYIDIDRQERHHSAKNKLIKI